MTARMESCWQLMQDRCWLGNVPAALLSTDTGKKGTNLCHPPSSSTLLLPRWLQQGGGKHANRASAAEHAGSQDRPG